MARSTSKAKFTTPPNKLKAKVGQGGIAQERLNKAQEYINTNTIDFFPYAKGFLKEVQKFTNEANNNIDRNTLVQPIMQLKASGGMFRYQLISDVADTCLQFVESIEGEINDDAFDIIQAHINTITIIINNRMAGNGGKEGKALIKELENACKRYFIKHKTE